MCATDCANDEITQIRGVRQNEMCAKGWCALQIISYDTTSIINSSLCMTKYNGMESNQYSKQYQTQCL